jgi:hypothetical protein
MPAELVFNVDEVDSQESAGRKKRDGIILHQVRPGLIEAAVCRSEKRISCITTISMTSDVLMPLLVIDRKTINDAA